MTTMSSASTQNVQFCQAPGVCFDLNAQSTGAELGAKSPTKCFIYKTRARALNIFKRFAWRGIMIIVICQIAGQIFNRWKWGRAPTLPLLPKPIFWLVLLPLSLYRLMQIIIDIFILPAAIFPKPMSGEARRLLYQADQNNYLVKRIGIECNGHIVDLTIIGNKNEVNTEDWVVISNGNGTCYEKLQDNWKQFAHQNMKATCVIYNYPSVLGSQRMVSNVDEITTSLQAVYKFIESRGGKKIVSVGISLGGCIASRSQELLPSENTIVVRYHSLSSIKSFLSSNPRAQRIISILLSVFRRNYDFVPSQATQKATQRPRELIIQRGEQQLFCGGEHSTTSPPIMPMDSVNQIGHDGLLARQATAAYALFPNADKQRQVFLLNALPHAQAPNATERQYIAQRIKELRSSLSSASQT